MQGMQGTEAWNWQLASVMENHPTPSRVWVGVHRWWFGSDILILPESEGLSHLLYSLKCIWACAHPEALRWVAVPAERATADALVVTRRATKTAASLASCVAIVQLRTSRSARCALVESTRSAVVERGVLKAAESLGYICWAYFLRNPTNLPCLADAQSPEASCRCPEGPNCRHTPKASTHSVTAASWENSRGSRGFPWWPYSDHWESMITPVISYNHYFAIESHRIP